MSAERVYLVDLDGTLTDPARGITGCAREALAALGREAPEDLRWIIGPPLRTSLGKLLGDATDEEAARAAALYRERYAAWGLEAAEVYEGVPEMLAALKAQGARLYLCTSKMTHFAERVLDHFGLAGPFDGIYGALGDGRFDDKAELIGHMLETLGFAPAQACMIGDRDYDVLAAARHGIPTLGVLWGYGGEAELTAAGAAALCATPAELPTVGAGLFGR